MPSEDTQFKKGTSGNLGGRPKGSKNRITLLKQMLEVQLREASQSRMPEILDKAMEMALAGDRTMLKLMLELHMSKGYMKEEAASEKVEINITTQTAEKKAEPPQQTDFLEVVKNG